MKKNPPLLPHERKLRVLVAGILSAGLLAVAFIEPRGQLPFPHVPCIFRSTTGLPCPFCGGTRAAHWLLQGNFARSLDLNVLAIPALTVILAVTLCIAFEAATARRIAEWESLVRRAAKFLPVAILLVVVTWIPQVIRAVQQSKTELVDPRNPIAGAVQRALDQPGAPGRP